MIRINAEQLAAAERAVAEALARCADAMAHLDGMPFLFAERAAARVLAARIALESATLDLARPCPLEVTWQPLTTSSEWTVTKSASDPEEAA